MARRKGAKPEFSKLVVAACIAITLAFTVACLVFYWNGKAVDPVLIGFVFGTYGVELGSCAVIKRGKLKYVAGEGGKVGHFEMEEDDDAEVPQ